MQWRIPGEVIHDALGIAFEIHGSCGWVILKDDLDIAAIRRSPLIVQGESGFSTCSGQSDQVEVEEVGAMEAPFRMATLAFDIGNLND